MLRCADGVALYGLAAIARDGSRCIKCRRGREIYQKPADRLADLV